MKTWKEYLIEGFTYNTNEDIEQKTDVRNFLNSINEIILGDMNKLAKIASSVHSFKFRYKKSGWLSDLESSLYKMITKIGDASDFIDKDLTKIQKEIDNFYDEQDKLRMNNTKINKKV